MSTVPLSDAPLRDGSSLAVHLLTPPETGAAAAEIHALINSHLSEPFHADCLAGKFEARESMRYFLGYAGDRLVGVCWLGRSPACPEVSCLAGVTTRPAFRRRGVARALCRLALDDFFAHGGATVYLAHANEAARRLYETMGFALRNPRIMVCARDEQDYEKRHFAPTPTHSVISAAWPDLARTVPLFVHPHPWYLLDARVKMYSTRYLTTHRCVGTFTDTWQMVRATRGAWFLLEAAGGRIVGSGVLYPEAATGGLADFVVHENHLAAAGMLFDALAGEAVRRGMRRVQMQRSARDGRKAEIARANGFRLTARAQGTDGFLTLAMDLPS